MQVTSPIDRIIKWVSSPYILLLLITLLGAVLRFYKLGEWGFWKDEIFTLGSKTDGLHLSFLGESFVRYLAKWCVSVLGETEWTARLIPAIIGIITIPIIFFPIRTLFGNTNALFSLTLLAVSPWHIYWSQTVRFYILLMLFAALTLLLLAISITKGKLWAAVGSLLFLFLAARESLVVLLIVPIAAGYLAMLWIFSKRRPRLKLRLVLPLLAAGGVIALYFLLPYLRDLPAWLAGFGRINNSPMWILAATVYYIGVPIVCLGLFSGLNLLAKKEPLGYLLIFWSILPLVVIMALAPFQFTATRYIFISLPAWCILASLAATQIHALVKNTAVLVSMGVIVLLLVAPLGEDFLYYNYQNGNREDGRGAYHYIRENLQPGDFVVAPDTDVGDYYLGEQTFPMEHFDLQRLKQYQRVWFVEDLDTDELCPGQMHWIRENAVQVANFDVHAAARVFKMRVYLYEAPGSNG